MLPFHFRLIRSCRTSFHGDSSKLCTGKKKARNVLDLAGCTASYLAKSNETPLATF